MTTDKHKNSNSRVASVQDLKVGPRQLILFFVVTLQISSRSHFQLVRIRPSASHPDAEGSLWRPFQERWRSGLSGGSPRRPSVSTNLNLTVCFLCQSNQFVVRHKTDSAGARVRRLEPLRGRRSALASDAEGDLDL